MKLTVYDQFEQNTDLWLLARCGMLTATCFRLMMQKGVGASPESKMRRKMLHRLGAELITGKPTPTYTNPAMQRGHLWEPDALEAYCIKTGATVDHVAFVRNHEIDCGCSPDGLIGSDGGVEVKTMEQDVMFGFLTAPGLPEEHKQQIQGCMWVTGREWWDLAIYSPGFDLWVERVGRDRNYIEEMNGYRLTFQAELAAAILHVTGETITTWKARHDQRLKERIEEETSATVLVGSVEIEGIPWLSPSSEEPMVASSFTEAVRKSLEREKWLEDGE